MTRVVLLVAMLGACAKGGAIVDDGGIDAPVTVHHDARVDVTPDASLPKDAATPIDAAVAIDAALPPDASTSGNICTSNAMCTDQGQCCVTLGGSTGFCANGVIIGSTCLPQ